MNELLKNNNKFFIKFVLYKKIQLIKINFNK